MDSQIWAELGGGALVILGAALTTSLQIGKYKERVDQAHAKIGEVDRKIVDHVKVDEDHHKEEQEQWRETNRSLGQIEGMLNQLNQNQSRPPFKSRP